MRVLASTYLQHRQNSYGNVILMNCESPLFRSVINTEHLNSQQTGIRLCMLLRSSWEYYHWKWLQRWLLVINMCHVVCFTLTVVCMGDPPTDLWYLRYLWADSRVCDKTQSSGLYLTNTCFEALHINENILLMQPFEERVEDDRDWAQLPSQHFLSHIYILTVINVATDMIHPPASVKCSFWGVWII